MLSKALQRARMLSGEARLSNISGDRLVRRSGKSSEILLPQLRDQNEKLKMMNVIDVTPRPAAVTGAIRFL